MNNPRPAIVVDPVTRAVQVPVSSATTAIVYRDVCAKPGSSVSQIAARTHIERRIVANALMRLTARKVVEPLHTAVVVRGGKGGVIFRPGPLPAALVPGIVVPARRKRQEPTPPPPPTPASAPARPNREIVVNGQVFESVWDGRAELLGDYHTYGTLYRYRP